MKQVEAVRIAAARRAYSDGEADRPRTSTARPSKSTRDELVKKHATLVLRIARKVRRRTGYAVELDDLVCEGTIGLLQAAERFDPERETDFEHLASVRVHGAMLDALRRLDPLSQRRRREARRHQKVAEKLERGLGRAPTPEEMADALGMDLEDYYKLNNELSAQTPMSLDDMGIDVRDKAVRQDATVHARQRHERMKELIEGLPERQRLVLSMVYYNELSQKEVARVLGVTEARVSQLHKEALGRLRKRLKSAARPDEDAW